MKIKGFDGAYHPCCPPTRSYSGGSREQLIEMRRASVSESIGLFFFLDLSKRKQEDLQGAMGIRDRDRL